MSKKISIKQLIKEELKNIMSEEKHFVNPTCPECHHYNAMLKSYKKKSNENGVSVLECRDCGFEAEYLDKEMIDIKSPVSGNSIKTYKRLDGEDGQLKEESEFSKDYIPMQVKNFIAKSDTNSPYKPQIQLNWGGDNKQAKTKWMSVPWEFISSIIDYFQKNPSSGFPPLEVEEGAVASSSAMENLKLTDAEIGVLVAVYNKYSGRGGGPVVDKKNYKYINPDFAVKTLSKYINDTNATDNGKLLASSILKKLPGK